MSGNKRILNWWETQKDATFIRNNKWLFNIAKLVTDVQGVTTSNIIWQSAGLAPMVNIEWEVDYALNWSSQLPPAGVSVRLGGNWQRCAQGESFDLDVNGFWQRSATGGKAGWMSVGKIDYSYPGASGIHMLVGVKNAKTGKYDTIYVDPTSLPPNSSAAYQPQETVQWWLAGGTKSGSVFSMTQGAVDTKDYSVPAPITGLYEFWTTYDSTTGTWIDTQTEPPSQILVSPSRDAHFFPLFNTVIFNIPIEVGVDGLTQAYLTAYLGTWYVSVSVNWLNRSDLSIEFGMARPEAHEDDILSQHLVRGNEQERIDQGLKNLQLDGTLPRNASWTIQQQLQITAGDNAGGAADTPQQPDQPASLQLLPADFAAQRAKKLAAISNPINGVGGINLAQRSASKTQSISGF